MGHHQDIHHMRHALALARRGRGLTWSNPSVGCVIVRDSRVVGRGWTGVGGRPHAETAALAQAGEQAKGATAYVSLEPCAHQGKTGPCAQALIEAGVRRVVIGCEDPDSRVSGRGVRMLEEAGIRVYRVLEDSALEAHKGFILRVTENRPLITLKIATTHDGFTVLPEEQGRWITGALARAHTHLERSMHDAVLVGIETVLADDPLLNARVPGLVHETVRVVLDTNLRMSPKAKLIENTPDYPLYILHNSNQRGLEERFLEELRASGKERGVSGIELIQVDTRNIEAVCGALAERGLTRVFVEGGAQVLRSFLAAELWDRFLWYRAPDKGITSGVNEVYRLDLEDMRAEYGLKQVKTRVLGEDRLEIYEKTA